MTPTLGWRIWGEKGTVNYKPNVHLSLAWQHLPCPLIAPKSPLATLEVWFGSSRRGGMSVPVAWHARGHGWDHGGFLLLGFMQQSHSSGYTTFKPFWFVTLGWLQSPAEQFSISYNGLVDQPGAQSRAVGRDGSVTSCWNTLQKVWRPGPCTEAGSGCWSCPGVSAGGGQGQGSA